MTDRDPPARPDRGIDADRAAVYAAEDAAFAGTDLEVVIGFGRAAAIAAGVLDHAWWSGPRVTIAGARSDAASSSCRDRPEHSAVDGHTVASEIRLAEVQTTPATVAHELAHALAGTDAGHGPTFRRALLDVVMVLTNLDSTDRRRHLHSDQLASQFTVFGLRVAARRWPAPPSDLVGPIEL